jgi:glycerophosphoryl diester phosphodiesterase
VDVIDELHLDDRCIVQSFDPAVLEAVRAIDPALRLSLLVENTDGIDANLKRLSFTPAFYSPAFDLVDKAAVDKLHALDIEVAVWTVNEVADMQRMAALGVDAIITDFPDRALRVVEELE